MVSSGQKKGQECGTWLVALSFGEELSSCNWFSADEKRPATHGRELDYAVLEKSSVISYCATSVHPSALLGLGETFGLYSNITRGFIKSTMVTGVNRKPGKQPGGLNTSVVMSPCFYSMKDETCWHSLVELCSFGSHPFHSPPRAFFALSSWHSSIQLKISPPALLTTTTAFVTLPLLQHFWGGWSSQPKTGDCRSAAQCRDYVGTTIQFNIIRTWYWTGNIAAHQFLAVTIKKKSLENLYVIHFLSYGCLIFLKLLKKEEITKKTFWLANASSFIMLAIIA